MHVHNSNAAVDHVHAVQSQDERDGSAAAQVYSAKLSSLEVDVLLLVNLAKMS